MIITIKDELVFKNRKPFELDISNEIKDKIDEYWNTFIQNNNNYWNGDIIVVTNIDLNNNILELGKTKYSSLIYAKANDDLIIRPLFTTILLKTNDNKYVIIKNNHNRINLIGGLADVNDFENNIFILEKSLKREILEEIGLDLNDESKIFNVQMKYLKVPSDNENSGSIGILYTGCLNFTSEEFNNYLSDNTFDGEITECYFYTASECLDLKLNKNDIPYLKEFIKIEN